MEGFWFSGCGMGMIGVVVICCGGIKVEFGFGIRVIFIGVVFFGGIGVVGGVGGG